MLPTILSSRTIFNFDTWTPNQHIRMITEGSCDQICYYTNNNFLIYEKTAILNYNNYIWQYNSFDLLYL